MNLLSAKASNDWAKYFDECWELLYPDLPLPYGPNPSTEALLRADRVRQYAEANASRWQLVRRRMWEWASW